MTNEQDRPVYTISIAADLLEVSVHTLRLYEQSGLIIPQRTSGKHRLYSARDVERLRAIRHLIEHQGLNIAGIKALLSLIPCWKIRGCGKKERSQCDAYNKMSEPCWIVKNKCDLCHANDCNECEVYQTYSLILNLKHLLNAGE